MGYGKCLSLVLIALLALAATSSAKYETVTTGPYRVSFNSPIQRYDILGGAIGETIEVGNYSFTFNMTEPHQIELSPIVPNSALIKTFDGCVSLNDMSWQKPEVRQPVFMPLSYCLGGVEKNIGSQRREYGQIYVSHSPESNEKDFTMVFDDFFIQSSLNLTRSIDFFRDLKVARITI